ncbi:co-chaperone GroES [Borrelia sp. RT5S]|uniref:co-chaperone GroES n=1 Tax=Borrelia sp. RT5S TaxID=2898581 RepID=UPI001E41EBBC|nr:co-chaperone GroES [Borrelia sp. RT5S]UGQ16393.1 co-chaperone GroES [Borrelia sp. RT5S]
MKNIKPLADRVLIKIKEAESKTISGLYIPENAKEKTNVGTVMAVGSNKEEITVKVGDVVLYEKYAGAAVKIEDREHLILKAKEVVAIIEE